MTTLAYRNGILAADTRMTLGDNVVSLCHKIYLLGDGKVLAAAGGADTIEELKFFLLGKRKSPPKNMKDVEGIFIVGQQPYFFGQSTTLMPIEAKFHAEGSGWQIAMAGMHMGLDACAAVALAGELDINTNSLVDYYNAQSQELVEVTFPQD